MKTPMTLAWLHAFVRPVFALGVIAAALASSACATVRPEQRQLLADPMMQFKGGERDERAKEHVLEYREGAIGGGSVRGGGCGCN